MRQGYRISDIGHAVQTYVEARALALSARLSVTVWASICTKNRKSQFWRPGRGPRMVKGMTLAVEPMVTEGTYEVRVLKDKWTTVTADGKLAAHYEKLDSDYRRRAGNSHRYRGALKIWNYPKRT